jgi:hypothetical protein
MMAEAPASASSSLSSSTALSTFPLVTQHAPTRTAYCSHVCEAPLGSGGAATEVHSTHKGCDWRALRSHGKGDSWLCSSLSSGLPSQALG